MGKFAIFKGINNQFYFNLKDGNGERILASEGYRSKSSCENGISSVKTNATDDSQYEKRESTNEQYYFVLNARNGEIIGTSEQYVSKTGRDKGIEAVKKEAPWAVIEHVNYYRLSKICFKIVYLIKKIMKCELNLFIWIS